MRIPLFEQVALRRDRPEAGLRAGDLATLLDYVPHPAGGEEGCVLEVFNALGESIRTVVAPVSEVEALRADEILSVRPLAEAR